MNYKLIKQLTNSSPVIIAEFTTEEDASLALQQFANDKTYRIQITSQLSVSNPFNIVTKTPTQDTLLARFATLDVARAFVRAKVKTDPDTIYYILDGDTFVEKGDASMLTTKTLRHGIRPPSLVPRLRPGGSATGMYNSDDSDDEDK